MRRLAAVAVLMLLAGCDRGDPERPEEQATSTTTSTTQPRAPEVEPFWVGLASPDASLRIVYPRSSNCGEFHHADVREDDESVSVTVYLDNEPPARSEGTAVCLGDLQAGQATLPLERPLGDRELRGGCADVARGEFTPLTTQANQTQPDPDMTCRFLTERAEDKAP